MVVGRLGVERWVDVKGFLEGVCWLSEMEVEMCVEFWGEVAGDGL